MKIIETMPGEAAFRLFEALPRQLYPANSLRLKQTDNIADHEFLYKCFVLVQNDLPKARVALYTNPHLLYENRKTACIGCYESVDEKEIYLPLINHASAATKQTGSQFIIGPMNGSTWNNYRFSIHADSPPFLSEPVHLDCYNDHFQQAGFHSIASYFSGFTKNLEFDHPDILKREKELQEEGITFRNIDLKKFDEELERIHEFNALAFKTNFLYTPINLNSFKQKYIETKKIIDPDFVILAEDKTGELIGYFFCFQDHLNNSEKSLVIKTIARHPAKKWKGLGHAIANRIYKRAVQAGFRSVIHAFLHDEGTSTAISKNFSGAVYKKYRLYGKKLEP